MRRTRIVCNNKQRFCTPYAAAHPFMNCRSFCQEPKILVVNFDVGIETLMQDPGT